MKQKEQSEVVDHNGDIHCPNCKLGVLKIKWNNASYYVCQDCAVTFTYDEIWAAPREHPAHERPIAYIAGALNDMSCDYIVNVRRMIVWAEKISDLGYAVFVPGLDLLWGIATGNLDYSRAFNNSQPFLAKSDILFVCPGWENSKGTKRELDTAKNLSVPIYYGGDGYKLLRIEFDQANDTVASDEESARDRRRPKERDDVQELNDEALVELERRIAESPYRTTGDKVPDKVKQDKVVCEQCKRFCVRVRVHTGEQDQFIEEANNYSILGYLKQDPHPGYRVVSVIPMPRATKSNPFGAGARKHTYIWELKDA